MLPAAMMLTYLALALRANAMVGVLPGEDSEVTSAFVDNLRIQLRGLAGVRLGSRGGALVNTKLAAAHAYLTQTGAVIVVWEERQISPETRGVDVAVMAVTQDTVVPIEVARTAERNGIDTERVLALKVGELLYRILLDAKSEQDLATRLAKHARPAATAPSEKSAAVQGDTPPLPAGQLRGFAELQANATLFSTASSFPVGLKLALGGAYERAAGRFEAYGAFTWWRETRTAAAVGSVSAGEYDVAVGTRALFRTGAFRWGMSLDLSANVLRARGITSTGRAGAGSVVGYGLGLGPVARVRLLDNVELAASAQLQQSLWGQRFALEEIPVVQLGGTRALGALSLVVSTP